MRRSRTGINPGCGESTGAASRSKEAANDEGQRAETDRVGIDAGAASSRATQSRGEDAKKPTVCAGLAALAALPALAR